MRKQYRDYDDAQEQAEAPPRYDAARCEEIRQELIRRHYAEMESMSRHQDLKRRKQ